MNFTYTIGKITESQNKRDRWHYMVRDREKNVWGQHLGVRRTLNHHCPPGQFRWVTITSYRPRLITDHANLVGGAKGLVDALVILDLLEDDSDSCAKIMYHQELARASPLRGNRITRGAWSRDVPIPCTVITISDVELVL